MDERDINMVQVDMTSRRMRRQSEEVTDAIIAWRDLRGRHEHALVSGALGMADHPSYIDYLDRYHRSHHGGVALREPPADVTDIEAVSARVNGGRWVWVCPRCGSGYYAERLEHHPHETHSLAMCVTCPETEPGEMPWVSVEFPTAIDEIESILLEMSVSDPHDAPIREWIPGWSIARLQSRLQRANDLVSAGTPYPRALSIGTARVWAVGEVLTAPTMQRYISDLIDDLAGRNGPIAFESSIALEPRGGRLTTIEGELSYEAAGKKFVANTAISGGREVRLVHIHDVDARDGDIICVDSSTEVGYSLIRPGAVGEVLTSAGPGLPPEWV